MNNLHNILYVISLESAGTINVTTYSIATLSTRTALSDRVSLNAFQNGGKPST